MRILNLLIAFLFTSPILAQTGTIRGTIADAETKSPLQGATININNDLADNADQFGVFVINNINPGRYELVASHIGYSTQIIPVEVKGNLVSQVSFNMRKSALKLEEVKIFGKKNSALNTLGAVDIMLRPVNTSQDVLRIVPGLFIAQHAGGGKAEQIFLRGYDIDHGTDISISVDGIPVNMVSHAHGQGYADLHFLIPETIEKVNFDKGPYFVSKGNLATAGFVDFNTKEFLTDNNVKLEVAQYNTQRAVGLFKLLNKEADNKRQQLYLASEYSRSDGFVERPQNFHRLNAFLKYNAWYGNQAQLTITASHFDSKWNASGQIPTRAVESGMITRFGSIDNSEGGNTNRSNLNIRFAKQLKNNWELNKQAYFSRYHFNLYSNFTFFLDDPINGDGINQRETRNIYGYNTSVAKTWMAGAAKARSEFGAGFRYDNVNDIELAKQVKRNYILSIQKGDVKELNGNVYWNQSFDLSRKVNINGGLRFDFFRFAYRDLLAGETDFKHQSKSILSPKLNFVYTVSSKTKIYLNNGMGFHSNDTRVILDNQADKILPRVYGTDLGIIAKPIKNLVLKTALWHLFSEQEFVYVGDAGIIEPSGKTRRIGIDLSTRYQFASWLFGDLDLNFTKARATEEAKGEDYVPLAPSFTSIGGLTAKMKNGFSGSVRYRFIGDRPADETNTIKAKGYFITDLTLSYQIKKLEFSLSAENIFEREWNEAQFNTESRLQFEPNSVSEIHFTPGTPRFIKGTVAFRF
jgi:outer membrane cobalamin receptor